MTIIDHVSLKPYNTFGIDVKAQHFASIQTLSDLKVALKSKNKNILVLGGGSNMLLTQDVEALVLHINLKGIVKVSETKNHVFITAQAGENWHDFVMWCLDHDFGGLENLSLIPGQVGTTPIQNIGAYGVELKDVFVSCEALNRITLKTENFSNKNCEFDYRHSIFKQKLKDQYIILNVTFKLSKKNHIPKTDYGSITEELKKMKINNPTIQDVSKAVIAIRSSKLPDPKILGNSGSFFKNPIVKVSHYKNLKSHFTDIPSYKISKNKVKIPAAWLIERLGFKGKRLNDYGVHSKQALVLVNYGNATGQSILKLSQLIQQTVKRIFDIELEAEVNII